MSDLRLNRQQLSQFLGNNAQMIRAFEQLFDTVKETIPNDLESVQLGAEAAQQQAAEALAGLALVAHQLSLMLLGPVAVQQDPVLPQDLYQPPTLEQLVQAVIEVLYAPPAGDLGTMAAQMANKVAVTGGAIDGTDLGQTTPGKGNFNDLRTSDDTNTYGLVAGRFSSGFGGAAINTRASCTFMELQVAGTAVARLIKATQAMLVAGGADDGVNKLQVNGGIAQALATALITTKVAMNNGAAAAVGTLNNAPVAGNPTKWVPFNDNGTTRYIPTW